MYCLSADQMGGTKSSVYVDVTTNSTVMCLSFLHWVIPQTSYWHRLLVTYKCYSEYFGVYVIVQHATATHMTVLFEQL